MKEEEVFVLVLAALCSSPTLIDAAIVMQKVIARHPWSCGLTFFFLIVWFILWDGRRRNMSKEDD